jgi:ABC-type lipoprotein export system ATPase subunit
VTYDEVLAGVSSENAENVFKLFRRILPNYDAIIHICHNSDLVDYHDQTLVVTKENNISKVELK